MKTKEHISIVWNATYGSFKYNLDIPAGTRVKPCNDGTGQFWVDAFEWVPSDLGLLRHDAVHYGIRLNADQVSP